MPTAAELLAALPADDVEIQRSHAKELDLIFQTLADRKMPTGAFRRFCSLGGLSAKLGLAYLAYWIRTWYRPTESREKDLLETNLRSALSTLETMGYLRGAVSKLGQMVTSFPDMVPKEFVDVLSSLHFQAPPMHYSLIREQLLNELGDPEDIFSDFDKTAVAAASIGQVHRARLKTGEEVAVKIQYPGIGRTIRADLRNLKALMRPMHINKDWKSIEAMFEELRVGLERETDFEQEANNQREIHKLLQDCDDVVIPNVIDEFSTSRVLTMEFLNGQTTEKFLAANPDQIQRDQFGLTITKVIFKMYQRRMLYSDSHPGNFLWMPDGRLGFIDFGNIRRFNDEEWRFLCEADRVRTGTEEEVEAFCKWSLMMTDEDARKHPEMLKLVIEGYHYYNEPVLYDGPFDYGDPDYLRRGAEWLHRASKQRWVKQQPANVFLHRLNFQLPALLFRLKSRVNVSEFREDLNPEQP